MALNPLPLDEAHLFHADTGSVTPALFRAYFEVLSSSELERHARFAVPAPALEFLLGRALVRTVLSGYLGLEPRDVALRIGSRGKPELDAPAPELDFSLSHSQGLVACLVARDCEVGVDVEDIGRSVEASSLATRFFHDAEARDVCALPEGARALRFFQYWTLKEACLKALGAGLSQPLDRFHFELDADGAPSLVPGPEDPKGWQVAQLRLEEQFLAAVAIKERRPEPPRRRIVVRRLLPFQSVR